MLVIEVPRIPPEGMDVDAPLDAGQIHVQGEESFALEAGGQVACRVEKGDDETVHVKGRLTARLGLECGRCLEAFSFPVDHALDLFYLPHQPGAEAEDEEEITERDLVVAYYKDGLLDLGDMVREQLFLDAAHEAPLPGRLPAESARPAARTETWLLFLPRPCGDLPVSNVRQGSSS